MRKILLEESPVVPVSVCLEKSQQPRGAAKRRVQRPARSAVWWSDDNNGELGSSFSQGGRGHQSAVTIVFTRMGRATSIYSSSSYYLTSKRRCISKCKFYTISTILAKCLQIKIDANVYIPEARRTECWSLKYHQLKFVQKDIIFLKKYLWRF